MRFIEPENQVEQFKTLEVGDILINKEDDVYILIYDTTKGYIFQSLRKDGGGWNGYHDTLESITNRTKRGLEQYPYLKLYRSSDYDLHLVPKQK